MTHPDLPFSDAIFKTLDWKSKTIEGCPAGQKKQYNELLSFENKEDADNEFHLNKDEKYYKKNIPTTGGKYIKCTFEVSILQEFSGYCLCGSDLPYLRLEILVYPNPQKYLKFQIPPNWLPQKE